MSYLQNRRMNGGDWLNYSLIVLMSLACVFPLIYVFSVSFTDPDAYRAFEFSLWPAKWSLAAYKYILSTSSFMDSLKATAFVTVIGTALNLFVTYTFAYGLTRKALPGRGAFLGVVFFTLIFNAGIVPNYLMMKWLGLLNTLWSLILFGLTNSWSIIVVKSFLQTLPVELEEAAIIDGCNDLGVFFKIIVPLSGASIAAFTLFFAVGHWNAYFYPLMFLTDPKKWMLQVLVKTLVIDSEAIAVGTAGSSEYGRIPDETIRLASIMLAMAPILVLYPFLQRYFVRGVMIGAIKG
jgi:putative aldouronate transport system permease protein